MDLIHTLLVMLATLGVLVAVHEFGHFWVARRCGVKVLRFSIGFGPPLYTWHDRQGTEYCIAAIPLGGYVRMLDEREGEVPEAELGHAFNRKPVLQRIAVVAAGPLANFLLAIVAYWGLFMVGESGYTPIVGDVEQDSVAHVAGLEPGQEIVAVDGEETPTWQALNFVLLDRIGDTGPIRFTVRYPGSDMLYESEGMLRRWLAGAEEPDLLAGLGLELYRPEILPVLGDVLPGTPAERAGLQSGDRIQHIDGESVALWDELVERVSARPGESVRLDGLRDGQPFSVTLVPEPAENDRGESVGRIGVAVQIPDMPPEMIRQFHRGPVESLVAGVERTGDLIAFTLNSVKKMLQGLISPKNLSGPITIAKVASASAKSGLEAWVGFLALLSVSLGVLNLLPIPVLDGGHLLYYTVELLVGRPVPEKVQVLGYQVGLFLILGIMMLALYNDFMRL